MLSERPLRISIIGNSVGLRMRPPRKGPSDRTYSERLADAGYQVENRCRAGVLSSEAFAFIDDELIARSPDVVIINAGIIEVFPRHTWRRLNNYLVRNYYNNQVLGRRYQSDTFSIRFQLARIANGVLRRVSRFLRLSWRWEPETRFLLVLRNICEVLTVETHAHILVLGVGPVSERFLSDYPSLNAEIDALNKRIEGLIKAFGDRAQMISIKDVIDMQSPESSIPDSIHFSSKGHREIFTEIERRISMIQGVH
jgi:lysophospholipase L1-like esterase